MSRRRIFPVAVLALATVLPVALAAQPYPGPPDSDDPYWEVPAFKDHVWLGPAVAEGVMFWSHGVAGKNVQWTAPPPNFVRDFAKKGWDVVKINRNNLMENGWTASGEKHVEHLIDLARKAKADGYKYIIAAGQSYGGAISLEAAATPGLFYGVIATAPGHGSDACNPNDSGIRRESDNLVSYLVAAIERAKAPRVVITMADGDECMGYVNPTRDLRRALQASAAHFIFLDDRMLVRGHGAVRTRQFRTWYSRCILDFFGPGAALKQKEATCAQPKGSTRFLLPAYYELPAPGPGTVGTWLGKLESDPPSVTGEREVCIAVVTASEKSMFALFAFGAGPERKLSMTNFQYSLLREGDGFVYHGHKNYHIEVMPSGLAALNLAITSRNGLRVYHATVHRATCM